MTHEEAQNQAAKEWNEAYDYRALRNGVQVGNIGMLHLDGVNKRAAELYARSKAELAWYDGYTTTSQKAPNVPFDDFMKRTFTP